MGDIAILNEKVSWLGLLERFPLNLFTSITSICIRLGPLSEQTLIPVLFTSLFYSIQNVVKLHPMAQEKKLKCPKIEERQMEGCTNARQQLTKSGLSVQVS